MFDAFLFDYRRKRSLLNSLKKLKPLEWVFLLCIPIEGILFIIFAHDLKLLGTVILLLVMFASLGAEIIYSKFIDANKKAICNSHCSEIPSESSPTESIASTQPQNCQRQLNYFLTQRVQMVQAMLDESITGLPINQCIALLLSECDCMLSRAKPSETIKPKIKPFLNLIGLIFGILFSAYVYKDYVGLNNESEVSFQKQIVAAFSHLVNNNSDLLPTFIVLALLVIIFYFFVVFIAIPHYFIPLLDRNWILAQELKDVLSYIKEKIDTSTPQNLDTGNI